MQVVGEQHTILGVGSHRVMELRRRVAVTAMGHGSIRIHARLEGVLAVPVEEHEPLAGDAVAADVVVAGPIGGCSVHVVDHVVGQIVRIDVLKDLLISGGVGEVSVSGGEVAGIAVIVDRSMGNASFEIPHDSLMKLELETYEPESCPLCEQGVGIDTPGSK